MQRHSISHLLLAGMSNGAATLENSLAKNNFLQKLNIPLSYNPVITFIGTYVTPYIYTKKMYKNVHSSFICNSQTPETASMSREWLIKLCCRHV